MMTRIGFIGLGAMGLPMARCLINAGFKVTGCDVDTQARVAFTAVGGAVVAAPAALTDLSDVIVTMLPNSGIVREALIDSGLVAALPHGGLVIDMSSGDPPRTRDISGLMREHGIAIVDAPVSGGVKRAEAGDLTIMLGGDPADCARAGAILNPMARAIHRTGPLGSAQAMKALNNLCSAAGFLIAAEALAVGTKFGLDPGVMIDVLNASTGANNSTQNKYRPFVLSGSHAGGFLLDLMIKDLGIAASLAEVMRVEAPLSSACVAAWRSAAASLGRGADHTEIARLVAGRAGISFAN